MNEIQSIAGVQTQQILNDPLFPHARLAYVDAILALYETNPTMTELMRDAARIMLYGIVMSFWGGYREQDRTTWPTISRLKETIAPFDVASDRQIDHIITRLTDTGFLEVIHSKADSRVRIVLPTRMMIEHDIEWMRAHYVPLASLYGEAAYALPLARDVTFHPYLRAANRPLFPHIAKNIMSQNKPMMRILNRTVGILALMKMVRKLAERASTDLSYTDIGSRFGVSRTHVRDIVSTAARHGEAVIEGRGRFSLLPPLLSGFDRLIADGMVVSDISYRNAVGAYRNHCEIAQGSIG